jgi:hypothetical protein
MMVSNNTDEESSVVLGLTPFSHMTLGEFKAYLST